MGIMQSDIRQREICGMSLNAIQLGKNSHSAKQKIILKPHMLHQKCQELSSQIIEISI